jgi:hypothetical protein
LFFLDYKVSLAEKKRKSRSTWENSCGPFAKDSGKERQTDRQTDKQAHNTPICSNLDWA